MTRQQLIDGIDKQDEVLDLDSLSLDDLLVIKLTQEANEKLLRGLVKDEDEPRRFYKQKNAIFYEK